MTLQDLFVEQWQDISSVKPLSTGNHIIKYQESVINALDSTGNDKRISGLEYHIQVENTTRP